MRYVLLLLLAGCGTKITGGIQWKPGYSTEELVTIIGEFEEDFDVKVLYPVLFVKEFSVSPKQTIAGVCYPTPRVELSANYDGDDELHALVYHELGHCSLNLKHYDNNGLDIMNSILWYALTTDFEFYRQQMLDNYANGVYEQY